MKANGHPHPAPQPDPQPTRKTRRRTPRRQPAEPVPPPVSAQRPQLIRGRFLFRCTVTGARTEVAAETWYAGRETARQVFGVSTYDAVVYVGVTLPDGTWEAAG